jgi:hypothetical protein
MAMPDRLEIEVSWMDIGDQVYVRDIAAPEGATILDELDTIVATVAAPRRMDLPEDEEAEEAVEGEEGELAEDGEAAAEPEEAGDAEPETES